MSAHQGSKFNDVADALIEAGRAMYGRDWVPATSGNFSCRYADDAIAITVSGQHKGRLDRHGIMTVDLAGQAADDRHASAEIGLHLALYRRYPWAGCVLHVHSPSSVVLSRLCPEGIRLQGMELFKALRGFNTHDVEVRVPVFANNQNIDMLSGVVEQHLEVVDTPVPGYVIQGHGIYAWGESIDEAMRHLEAFDHLFQCELASMRVYES